MNEVVALPERQVLPRFSDHAEDIAYATGQGADDVDNFICDYQRTFHTVSASPGEARFNCCQVETPLRRSRAPLDPGEPVIGYFLVWLVLGFGGRAFPLLYARVALVRHGSGRAHPHTPEYVFRFRG